MDIYIGYKMLQRIHKAFIHFYLGGLVLRYSVHELMIWYTLGMTNDLLQIWFQVWKNIPLKLNMRHVDNMTLIIYPIHDFMRQSCIIRRKVETSLKTALMNGERIQVREPVESGHFGKINHWLFWIHILMKLYLTWYPHTTMKVVLLSECCSI